MNLYLFDDQRAQNWHPFTLTRPVGELTLGCLSMRERAEVFWSTQCSGHLTRPNLIHFDEPNTPPVIELADISNDKPLVLFLSRAVPNLNGNNNEIISEIHLDATPRILLMDDEVVGWSLPEGFSDFESLDLLDPSNSLANFPALQLSGNVMQNIWDLVSENGEQIGRDSGTISQRQYKKSPVLPDGVTSQGDYLISIQKNVKIDPSVHLDSSLGPIFISSGVRISAYTHIIGPTFIGPDTHLLGGYIRGITSGASCKLRGEISNSVILSYTNKAHEGYIGNSYVGNWVNLGAFTSNSDLKNNYGDIKIHTPEGIVSTGNQKLGVFVGDHVKTGIGTLLPAGCVIGSGTNIFGGGMAPSEVPPFSWGTSDRLEEYKLQLFLRMVSKAMGRRGLTLTAKAEQLLIAAWGERNLEYHANP